MDDMDDNEKSWKCLALMVSDAEARFEAAERAEADEMDYTHSRARYVAWLTEIRKKADEALRRVSA